MTGIDWLIVGIVLLLALFGWAQGFVAGALALVGFAIGAWLGIKIGPLFLSDGKHSPWAPAFALIGALVAGGVFALGLEGVGARLRSRVRSPAATWVDGLLGALLTACVGLGIAWIIGAIAVQSTNSENFRADIQRSAILRGLNDLLPPSGPILHALSRFDPLPSVRGPAADVPPPTRGILATRGVRDARRSVVRVVGTACGLGIEGSGWVAGTDLVVTNAHVVAGESDTVVQVGGIAPGLPARAVVFDPHDDIAVLRVPGLNEPTLKLEQNPRAGTSAAILGYPLDGPFNAQAGRIGQTQNVNTQDAYGNGPVQRSITSLRGHVRPGNSGGPMIDAAGRVVATVFAAITGGTGSTRGGFAVPNALVRTQVGIARSRSEAVSTQGCAG
jgi:S1-C subfamily serine protease